MPVKSLVVISSLSSPIISSEQNPLWKFKFLEFDLLDFAMKLFKRTKQVYYLKKYVYARV